MRALMNLTLVLLTAALLALGGCGGGGGSSDTAGTGGNGGNDGGGSGQIDLDRDDDGIPNSEDAFPDDDGRFAGFTAVLLDSLGGLFSAGIDVNENDQVIGMADDGTAIKGVRWEVDPSAGTATAPVVLEPLAGNDYSAAYGNNDLGIAVGESEDEDAFVAVLWPTGSGTPAELNLAGIFNAPSAAYSINNSGQIVGEAGTDSGQEAILWNDETASPVALGTLGGSFSAAYFINDNGLIVGESETEDGLPLAVLWRVDESGAVTDGPIPLAAPAADFISSVAFGVDHFGRVVGEAETAAGIVHAVLWTLDPVTLLATESIDLGVAGENGSAYAVNDTGRLVGWDSRGGETRASTWDSRAPSLIDSILEEGSFSQAFGLNEGNLAVGVADGQAFVALPQQ